MKDMSNLAQQHYYMASHTGWKEHTRLSEDTLSRNCPKHDAVRWSAR